MMENNWRIADLIKKHLNGDLDYEEQQELDTWLAASADNRRFFEQYSDPEYIARELRMMAGADTDEELGKTLHMLGIGPKRGLLAGWRKYAVAAAVLLAAATGGYFLLRTPHDAGPAVVAKHTVQDVAPGGDKAILTLDDGTPIVLDSAGNGELARQGKMKVIKAGGQLQYSSADAAAGGSTQATAYNTVRTPRGGQYQLVLADGTKVWLNAASRLRFPIAFNRAARSVELSGEGYFEVAHATADNGQRIPFTVLVSREGQPNAEAVEVLGTHFNIQAYGDEPQVKTTLLEGSVQVKSAGSAKPALLKPGQQAQLAGGGGITIDDNADVEQAVAWKNGMQVFHDTDMRVVLRQLARWYNIDVKYNGDIPALGLSGTIPRSTSLKHVLEALALNSNMHFDLDGGVVTVSP